MKFADLFCGAGGLSCGLEQSGFFPVFASEIAPVFADTYQLNNPGVHLIKGDIGLISQNDIDGAVKDIKAIDLVAGGPPCQGYSIISPARTVDDPRNHLFEEYIRIVEYIRPRAIIIENVPGIISFEKGLVVKQIYEKLNKLGYKVDHKILCAAHYGVPQTRFRAIFIGILNYKKNIKFPFPAYKINANRNFASSRNLCFNITPLEEISMKKHVSVDDAIGDLPIISDNARYNDYEYDSAAQNDIQEYFRFGSDKITSHWCARLSEINRKRLKYIPQGGSWRDIPYELLPAGLKRAKRSDHTKRYGRLLSDGLCSTIQTKCDPHWGCFFHPTQDRVISVREAARLQSFPDRIRFSGSMTEQYTQVGNAVPPLLAKAVGECVAGMLDGI